MSEKSNLTPANRFTQGLGLLDASLAQMEKHIAAQRATPRPWQRHSVTSRTDDALEFLSTLTFPASRHVAFATRQNKVALINNARNGSDYADYTLLLPHRCQCKFARILNCSARVWVIGPHREVLQYEARVFELYDAAGKLIRAVSCMDDGGRWRFTTTGTPHPIEANFPYDARRKTDRFSEENLHKLAEAHGLPIPDANDFMNAGQYLLYTEDHGRPLSSITLEEADDPAHAYYLRAVDYAKHMDTHADSVIHDLEKCLALNPSYGPRTESLLAEARRRKNDMHG